MNKILKPVNENCIGKEILFSNRRHNKCTNKGWERCVLLGILKYYDTGDVIYYCKFNEKSTNEFEIIGETCSHFLVATDYMIDIDNVNFKRCDDVIYGDEDE